MEHQLLPLPYSKNALQPFLSEETLEFHYEKHHRTYLNNLNKLLVGTKFINLSLEEIIRNSSGSLFNNAAQVWNHSFFWNCLTPKSNNPTGEIVQAINTNWGSIAAFEDAFITASMNTFGSGWVWLIKNNDSTLEIISTSNAQNPIIHYVQPLLTVDVWEHAYYIDYRNARQNFLQSFVKNINWDFVAHNLVNNI